MPLETESCLKRLELKTYPGHPKAASLEGLPNEIKLKILTLMGDLPSLRRLKLASQAYYATARAHESYLKTFYRREIDIRKRKRNGSGPRGVFARQEHTHVWSKEAEGALLHAMRDWNTNITAKPRTHKHGYRYTMSGKMGFEFDRMEYVVFRMYVLTGEHFDKSFIAAYMHEIKSRFREKFKDAVLEPGDL